MGARPLAAFLSLALPAETDGRWTAGFFRGLRALADEFAVPLAGGDTAESPSEHILADIVLMGSAPAGEALRRSTARAGDMIYVTGHLGGAAAELLSLKNGAKPGRNGEGPQLFPRPRLAVGQMLRRLGLATACIDISDGLSTDLRHLCEESELSAEIETARLPVHPLAAGRVELALHGGEDYELLFAAKPGVKITRSIAGIKVTKIGRFVAGGRPLMVQLDERSRRRKLEAAGWEHRIG
jgi:thiamine-monophosphate kinase